ncbi:MAG TPA: aminodeoxychorismate synthase component I [Pseudonocardiaceae bacterium]|jgi:para-aminobenzoate synthetase|nr:aminodeoxychorismate synthase component I [Pseudonocardiaceae bacterium]
MRTLIIDNYDSFTYNLFQYLAEINGTEPIVVRNDAPGWRVADLDEFDNVVISPGPGRPSRASDFGFSRDAVLGAQIPLLGVCLGHQGLCELSGGSVGTAPEVFHGRESDVLHDGVGLFAGLPSPLRVVRYHSLTVTRVPDDLKIIAWTGDGVIMGVRHRDRPAWGVQFHPESIRTEHGMDLLGNFARLSREWRVRNPARRRSQRRPAREPVPPPSRERALRVLVTQSATTAPTELVFQSLYGSSPHSFWLDSSGQNSELGRFSFLGDSSGPLARLAYGNVWQGTVTVHTKQHTDVHHIGFFDWLDNDLRFLRVAVPELPFDFALGWVGYAGYELKAECGGMPAHRSENPDAAMIFADRALAVDHLTGTTYLLALADPDTETSAREWLRATRARLDELAGAARSQARGALEFGYLGLRHDRTRYLELIACCQAAIKAGESYEVCLTNMVTGNGTIDPWRAYQFLRAESPAPFGAWLRFADLIVLSTSPERFIRVSGDRVVESRPIKGTRPRGLSAEQDRALAEDLARSEKDRAENLMIVDLVRNDLGTCALPGSVHVPKIFDVESYAHVHQLVSTVRARLRDDVSAVGCVRAAFPGGSMTGAPKIRTMQIIDGLEGGARGIYSGALGYFSLSGAADLSIVIRTLVITPGKVSFGVGGAITALSDPGTEFDETVIKASGITSLLGTTFPDIQYSMQAQVPCSGM